MRLVKSSSSLLRKFLVFNFFVFLFLSLLTFFYLSGIQPNLVKQRMEKHTIIINNTSNHLERLSIDFNKESLKNFLLSTRFLFQNLERVQFYNIKGDLIADTNVLDLDQSVFSKTEVVTEEEIKNNDTKKVDKRNLKNNFRENKNEDNNIKEIINNKKNDEPAVLEVQEGDNLFIKTLGGANINGKVAGYILVTEQTNEILTAVEERKNFIIRTVLAIAIVIFIFLIFLNRYILKPIGGLVAYTESIKAKDESMGKIEKFLSRSDELGLLSRSLNNMTKDLQYRTQKAENSSADLAHEIRNPLASLKGASELLDNTTDKMERSKLIKLLSHDVERIERLITDYSQMLKDEASLSREKMRVLDISNIIKNVIDEFNNTNSVMEKNIRFTINRKNLNGSNLQLLGIENRLEQVLANLLDNAVSFSPKNSTIIIDIDSNKKIIILKIKDVGPGFNETNTEKIFKRFYSNRPEKFGEHSGLGLNIVKSIVEMHGGKVRAINRSDVKTGAEVELQLPKRG
tara:strand:+ start:1187 stop:2731 length:1545 start_codon:yes stop_codon:yes gene_type:complete